MSKENVDIISVMSVLATTSYVLMDYDFREHKQWNISDRLSLRELHIKGGWDVSKKNITKERFIAIYKI